MRGHSCGFYQWRWNGRWSQQVRRKGERSATELIAEMSALRRMHGKACCSARALRPAVTSQRASPIRRASPLQYAPRSGYDWLSRG